MKTQSSTFTARPDPDSLKLVVYPYPTLKKMGREVTAFDDWLVAVVQRMRVLMEENKGVGLAAPQVGLPLRVFVAAPSGKQEEAKAYINPVLVDEHGSEEGEEGCLSLPDIRVKIPRFTSVRIEAMDEHGHAFVEELQDYAARIMQHENDHLDGILLLDRMSPVARMANRKKIAELEAAAQVRKKR